MSGTWFRDLLHVLVPRMCPICGNRLMGSDMCLCVPCRTRLHYLGQTTGEDTLLSPTSKMFWGLLPIERATSYVYYGQGAISHDILIHIKYLHRPQLAVEMGQMMAQELLPRDFFQGIDYLVPVPLHWRRMLHRGYNQSERIAQGISNITGIPVLTSVVSRVRNNQTQTHLNKQEREKNVENIFRARHTERLRHKHLLIIDDVMTTGSTIISCGREITKAEPTVTLSVLTLGRARL